MEGGFAGGRKRSQVEGSGLRWREHSLVEEHDLRWRGAVSGGGERSQVEESDSDLWWRDAVSGGGDRGERSQVEVSGRRRRGEISGRGE